MASTEISYTVATMLVADDRELLFLNNGDLEVEDPRRNYEENSNLPYYCYSKEQLRKIRRFLNQPKVVNILEQ